MVVAVLLLLLQHGAEVQPLHALLSKDPERVTVETTSSVRAQNLLMTVNDTTLKYVHTIGFQICSTCELSLHCGPQRNDTKYSLRMSSLVHTFTLCLYKGTSSVFMKNLFSIFQLELY